MNRKKRLLIAGMSGLVISGAGLCMVALGGWGPCGPASPVAALGGWLSLKHAIWLSKLVPGLEDIVGRLHGDLLFFLLWPALLWSVAAFVALSCWERFKHPAHEKTTNIH